MGNCLVCQDKVFKVTKTEGEVLEYKLPMKVYRVLSEYAVHAVSDTLPVIQHLGRDADIIGGLLYDLLPLPLPSLKLDRKMICYSSSKLVEGGEGVLRIKLVISKQELERMMGNGCDVVSQLQDKESSKRSYELHDECHENSEGWKPVLASIPEED